MILLESAGLDITIGLPFEFTWMRIGAGMGRKKGRIYVSFFPSLFSSLSHSLSHIHIHTGRRQPEVEGANGALGEEQWAALEN